MRIHVYYTITMLYYNNDVFFDFFMVIKFRARNPIQYKIYFATACIKIVRCSRVCPSAAPRHAVTKLHERLNLRE